MVHSECRSNEDCGGAEEKTQTAPMGTIEFAVRAGGSIRGASFRITQSYGIVNRPRQNILSFWIRGKYSPDIPDCQSAWSAWAKKLPFAPSASPTPLAIFSANFRVFALLFNHHISHIYICVALMVLEIPIVAIDITYRDFYFDPSLLSPLLILPFFLLLQIETLGILSERTDLQILITSQCRC